VCRPANDNLPGEIASAYGFSRVEEWLWIGSKPGRIATLQVDADQFVARFHTDTTRAIYIAELLSWLEGAGVEAEVLHGTVTGARYTQLSTGESVLLTKYCPGAPSHGPLSPSDARIWGRFAARLHAATEGWCPSVHVQVPLLEKGPETLLSQALEFAAPFCQWQSILARFGPRVIVRCRRLLAAVSFQPIHGDLWPGNLLRTPTGFRAIDFEGSGSGPRTIDMASAYRWMPWRENRATAAVLWQAWLAGYLDVHEPSELEIASVPALASLQHLYWLIVEARAVPQGTSGEAELAWYVEDHCGALQVLLESTGI